MRLHPTTTIRELVSEERLMAAVLHHFGIDFFRHEEHTFQQVCRTFRVSPEQLTHTLEQWAQDRREPAFDELYLHPIEVLVEYLTARHRQFVRQDLPFLSQMIAGIVDAGKYQSILLDLNTLFPLFVDDFVHHLKEEEEGIFLKIGYLSLLEKGQLPLHQALQVWSKCRVSTHLDVHDQHDDEMQGIRSLTCGYAVDAEVPFAVRVLYEELQVFERKLQVHAKIEDELLFPKAAALEKEVERILNLKIKAN